MELSSEFIEQNSLTPEQVTAISTFGNDYVSTVKQDYDQTASKNADNIISGAMKKVSELTGRDRAQGEKAAEFIARASSEFFESQKTELSTLKKDYEEKLKSTTGNDDLKRLNEELAQKVSDLQKAQVELEPLKGYDEKYNTVNSEYGKLKEEIGIDREKPTFPAGVNKYEIEAKWSALRKEITDKYTIEIVDGKGKAIDKDNPHRTIDVSKLVADNAEIQELLKGRQQVGLNGQQADYKKVEGVPFEVPKGADSQTITKLVQAHLQSQGISKVGDTAAQYTKQFGELFAKVKQAA